MANGEKRPAERYLDLVMRREQPQEPSRTITRYSVEMPVELPTSAPEPATPAQGAPEHTCNYQMQCAACVEEERRKATSPLSGMGAREFAQVISERILAETGKPLSEATAVFVKEHIQAHAAEQVRQADEKWSSWGIIEVAVRNPQVAEYCKHWESRTCSAEAEVAELRQERDADRKEFMQMLEYCRTLLADGMTAVRKAMQSREWLTEGRGCYEWNDDNWHKARIEQLERGLNDASREFAPPGFREQFSKEWMAQTKINDFNNWLVAEVAELRQERDAKEQQFGNVLAVIHRDGGHYIKANGFEKACIDAEKIVLSEREARERAARALQAFVEYAEAEEKLSKHFLECEDCDPRKGQDGECRQYNELANALQAEELRKRALAQAKSSEGEAK